MRRQLLTKSARSIQPSVTQAISAEAKRLREQGIDVIDFGLGEPDFNTPDHIKMAAKDAIDGNKTRYTPAPGLPELRAAISEKWEKRGVLYQPSQIAVSTGGKGAIAALFNATLEEGDEVIIPTPYWVSYPELVRMRGAIPVHEKDTAHVHCTDANNFQFDVKMIRRLITPKTKFIIYSSPSNPTGTLLTRGTLEDLADLVMETGVSVISDEMYADILYDDYKHVSIASFVSNPKYKELEDLVFVVDGVSKSYAMTGWRVGWVGGPLDVMKSVIGIKGHSEGNVSNIDQIAALAALNRSQAETRKMVREFAKRKEYVWSALCSIPSVSCNTLQGAFYAFPDVSAYYQKQRPDDHTSIKGSADMAKYLLEHAHVAVTPGIAFGRDEYMRISYATSMPQIKKGIERIEKALSELRPAR